MGVDFEGEVLETPICSHCSFIQSSPGPTKTKKKKKKQVKVYEYFDESFYVYRLSHFEVSLLMVL